LKHLKHLAPRFSTPVEIGANFSGTIFIQATVNMPSKNLSHNDYTVGWISALPLEIAAAAAMLDKRHKSLLRPSSDQNTYTLGEISGHNVVIACLPSGVYGTTSAATVGAQMLSTFPAIRFSLVVGIGGGVPSKGNDIRLGDVAVSKPAGTYGGVVQYDYGKTLSGGHFQQTGILNQPPPILLTAISQLQSISTTENSDHISRILSETFDKDPGNKDRFSSPGSDQDHLFNVAYDHVVSENTCIKCDLSQTVTREPRDSNKPQAHYGLIASGNQVIKDANIRDQLAQKTNPPVLCFEMEAAGLMNNLPCLVIRGISDYSDSHKNKKWQKYAALTAAVYAKQLLSMIPPPVFEKTKPESGSYIFPLKKLTADILMNRGHNKP
jgi:nucleoside phosphorylase